MRRVLSRRVLAPAGAIGLITALLLLLVADWALPGARLTGRDVDAAVARALASASPTPPAAVGVYEAVRPSVVQVLARIGESDRRSGSGVVIDDAGHIITSHHVIDGATEIRVILDDGTELAARIEAVQPANDIAVIRALGAQQPFIPATLGDPRSLSVGDEAIVIGHPYGLRYSLSTGSISGLGRSFQPPGRAEPLRDLIQFDAAANPGNSGGPLLNRAGEVVGIVTGIVSANGQEGFAGIGFAVRIDAAAGALGLPPE